MKIITAYNYDPSNLRGGGGIKYVHTLLKSLLDKDIEITLFGVKLSENQTFDNENFEFIPVLEGTDNWWKFLLKLKNVIKSNPISNVDIIHTHNPLTMNPFIKTYPTTPKVCTLHGMPLDWLKVNYSFANPFISPVYKLLERRIIDNVDRVTTAGSYTQMRLLKRYPQLDLNKKVISIPSGVDLDQFKPMEKDKLKKELELEKFREIIIFVGRIAEIKNLKLLLKSYSRFKKKFINSALIIVGRGEKEKEIQDLTKKLDLKDVIFIGEVSSEQVVKYINCADVLALMSWFEASPTVVREALSCGVPVVSTNVGDVKTIIKNKYLGEVVNSYNEKDFNEALMRVIDLGKKSQDKVIDTCRRLACKEFSFDYTVSKYMDLYNDIKMPNREYDR